MPLLIRPRSLAFRLLAAALPWVPSSAWGQVKQTIDEELLSALVMAKQEEIKQRAIRDLVRPNLSGSNIATYNTMLDLVDVLLKEKNKSAMTRDLVRIVAEHSVAYAATWYFIKQRCTACGARPDSSEWLKASDSAWEKLLAAYQAHQRTSPAGAYERARTCGDPPYEIRLFNYLLDTISLTLRSENEQLEKWLRPTGLFTRSKQRDWQGTPAQHYKELWHGNEQLQGRILAELDICLRSFGELQVSWEAIVAAISSSQAKKLKDLDLRQLAGTKVWNASLGAHELMNEQVVAVFELFRKTVELYRHDRGRNHLIARFADLVDKYLILDPERMDERNRLGFSIDVESIILSLEDRIGEGRLSPSKHFFNLRPYFTVGLNYGGYRGPFTGFGDTTVAGVRTVAWAGEKLGLKWRIADFKYARNQPAGEFFQYHGRTYKRLVRPKDPFISNVYANAFASGLLYTIADLRTDKTFDYPVVGAGAGLTWFNGLESNICYVAPIIGGATLQENIDAGFWSLALDIPLFEYIKAAREKRGK
jgi:hypothetical protein